LQGQVQGDQDKRNRAKILGFVEKGAKADLRLFGLKDEDVKE
jgi:hypothetical protein